MSKDIYKEVANRTGNTREEIKWGYFHLWYGNNKLPNNENALIDYLVNYFGGDKNERSK